MLLIFLLLPLTPGDGARLTLPPPGFASLPVPGFLPSPEVKRPDRPVEYASFTSRQRAAGWHVHTCDKCGHQVSHTDSMKGNLAAHTCPSCNEVFERPWYPSERGVRLYTGTVRKANDYQEIYDAVMDGRTVTVSVGFATQADFMIDRIEGCTPGVWTFWLQDGSPVMAKK